MQLPDHDAEKGKEKLAQWYASLEKRLLNECAALAKSGFADRRVAAAAYGRFEEAFLLMRKALRLAGETPDPNDYGKVDQPGPLPEEFKPDVEPRSTTRWQDAEPAPKGPADEPSYPFPPIQDYRSDGKL